MNPRLFRFNSIEISLTGGGVKSTHKTGIAILWIVFAFFTLGCEPAVKKKDLSGPAQYVGSATCQECHTEIYDGWRSTVHPYKFQDINPKIVVADFEKNNTLKAGNYTNKMRRQDDDYFITTIGPDNKEHEYKVKYTIGSVWKQRYVTEFPNGALHILPVQWNVKTGEWVDYHGLKKHKPGNGKYWSDSVRTYQYKCSGCHNTGTQINHDEKTNIFKTTWAEKGVGCEGCHGPGSHHVEVDIADKATTITNPAKIYNPTLAAMTCGVCHTRGTSADGKFGYAANYLPGDHLDFQYDYKPGLNPDGSARQHHQQYNDWLASGHNQAGIQCWNCHYSHEQGKANKFQLKLPGSTLCRSCHTVENQGVHEIHSVNNCVGCHMPNTAKSATPGDIRSHSFKVIHPSATIQLGKKQPNSCNLCHYHKDDSPESLMEVLNNVKETRRKQYLP